MAFHVIPVKKRNLINVLGFIVTVENQAREAVAAVAVCLHNREYISSL